MNVLSTIYENKEYNSDDDYVFIKKQKREKKRKFKISNYYSKIKVIKRAYKDVYGKDLY